MVPVARREIPLNLDSITVRDPETGDLAEVAVRLQQTRYRVEMLRRRPLRTSRQEAHLACYELVSDGLYTWARWPVSNIVGRFRLLPVSESETYLGWARPGALQLAPVTRPLDRTVALARRFREVPEPTTFVPVGRLVPRARRWGRDALVLDAELVSLERDEEGRLRLTISNPEGTDVVVLVREEDEWRVAEDPEAEE